MYKIADLLKNEKKEIFSFPGQIVHSKFQWVNTDETAVNIVQLNTYVFKNLN